MIIFYIKKHLLSLSCQYTLFFDCTIQSEWLPATGSLPTLLLLLDSEIFSKRFFPLGTPGTNLIFLVGPIAVWLHLFGRKVLSFGFHLFGRRRSQGRRIVKDSHFIGKQSSEMFNSQSWQLKITQDLVVPSSHTRGRCGIRNLKL